MITSKQNHTFKKLKKLQLKKYRDLYQQFLVYGDHLIEQAQKNNAVVTVFTSNEEKPGTFIAPSLMKELSQTKTVFEQMALCKPTSENNLLSDKILVLDDIQDPANLGALMRSASAFGFNQVFASFHSADFYHEKTIRSSQGALFSLSLKRGNTKSFLEEIKEKNYSIFSAFPQKANITMEDAKKYPKKVLVLGNEGQGISLETEALSDYFVNICTQNVESLNVAVAGSILMYLL
ncbi:rRNA methyltransferase [Hydrangea phyllody phytoplasma]|uniref:rRNA methyltransferase n=2 Tax=16SrI (Aster yellows group) TaxID=3042590 RepID=A0ABQ5PSN8_9MOLU|nr:RNA methyltransferase [Hydrangea phyllody phytoplasma]GFZ75158.1 rRNA methyltransferase [Hydrangea phyllody phytoplasma]GLH61264.1 rRNA methyltransferase [Rhus yellows phytoplasma]GLH61708.1 rRNA methyltransferase [Hydrangea phyllody phytoplasma]